MSFELTPDRLRDISVNCVSQYMTKQASLSQAIAKEAQDLELNPDQIKRVVESTNTIAYLRQLEEAKDRTFEFPLADYKEVIATMVLPEKVAEDKGDEEKEEEGREKKENRKEDDDEKDDDKNEKSDSESQQEKIAMLSRETLRCMQVMEKIACDKIGLAEQLVASAKQVSYDPLALEKIAFVVTEDDFDKLLNLCGIEKRAERNEVFTDGDLLQVRNLYGMYKEAKSLLEEEKSIVEFLERASNVLEKTAFAGAMAGLAGKVIGKTVTAIPKAVVGKVGNSAKNIGKFSNSAAAKKMGTKDAVKSFDKIKATKGTAAAKQAFGGASPSIIHRKGVMGTIDAVGTAATGLALTHENDVWDSLQKNK